MSHDHRCALGPFLPADGCGQLIGGGALFEPELEVGIGAENPGQACELAALGGFGGGSGLRIPLERRDRNAGIDLREDAEEVLAAFGIDVDLHADGAVHEFLHAAARAADGSRRHG